MPAIETAEELSELIVEQGINYETLLIVGDVPFAGQDAAGVQLSFADVASFTQDERADLGVIIRPAKEDAATISRLRDVLCRRVLIVLTGDDWSRNELLALGFQELSTDSGPRLFLYDFELVNQPREWNNPSNWAHPENFDKYRW